jgi:hypothetical protein
LGDVLELFDILGLEPAVAHALAEKADVIVGPLDSELQALQLELAQLGERKKIRSADRMKISVWRNGVLAHKRRGSSDW